VDVAVLDNMGHFIPNISKVNLRIRQPNEPLRVVDEKENSIK
jgi:hypothetical protein